MTQSLKEHPLAALMPLMSETDVKELAADIKLNGQLAPITLLEGKILDGRNRYRACRIARVEPRLKEFKGPDPLAFIISANVRRRHLTESQRALIAARVATMPEGRPSSKITASREAVSQKDAASQLDVSRATVQRAKEVLDKASPEDIKAVERGEKTVTEVARAIKAKTEKVENPVDRTGHPIPDSIIDEWERAEETAKRILSQISETRSLVKSALDDSDPIFIEVTNGVVADLNNAYGSLKCVRPYAVCTTCQGHHRKRCSLCKGRGFISEFAWRTFVPAETKKMRAGGSTR